LDVRGGLRQRAGRASADGDMRAFACQFFSDSPAEPFAGRRNDRYAATKPQIHFLYPTQNLNRLAKRGERQRRGLDGLRKRILFAWRKARH